MSEFATTNQEIENEQVLSGGEPRAGVGEIVICDGLKAETYAGSLIPRLTPQQATQV